ncbi:MAG: EexN family lipoprotein [Sulfurovaceae bacterium]|nr:EexN family lipoprotein [Sulfurovaceae bacterium]
MKKLILSVTLTFIYVGCSNKAEETKTVDYYQNNPTQMDIKIKECLNNPGELKDTPNCKNAAKAQQILWGKSNVNITPGEGKPMGGRQW